MIYPVNLQLYFMFFSRLSSFLVHFFGGEMIPCWFPANIFSTNSHKIRIYPTKDRSQHLPGMHRSLLSLATTPSGLFKAVKTGRHFEALMATMKKCVDWVSMSYLLKGAKMFNYRAQKWWIWILSLIGIFRKYPPLFWNQPLCSGWQFSILCVFKTSNNQRVNTNVTQMVDLELKVIIFPM